MIKSAAYWFTTLLVSAMMLMSGVMYLTHKMDGDFAHLGYQPFFVTMLGIAKILGVIVLLAPRQPLLKEWAYAGFTFTFIAACVSHLHAGDGPKAIAPAVALAVLAVSYVTRPAKRRV